VFPFGGELFFSWPVLFTRSELLGRMVFWWALPLLAAGTHALVRELGLSRRSAAAGALLIVTTPTVLQHAVGLKPDLWLAAFVVGAAFWSVRGMRTGTVSAFAWAGVFLALASNVKLTGLLLAPLLVFVLPWRSGLRAAGKRLAALAVGAAGGALLGGLGLTLGSNIAYDGHPFGPSAFRATHRPDAGLRQVHTHLCRVPLVLFELPWLPAPRVRAALETAGNRLLAAAGADAPLPLEENPVWPGRFRFQVGEHATRYSLGGLLWLPAVAIVGGFAAARAVRGKPAGLAWVPAALSFGLLAGLVVLVRWMGGGPERFWIPAYALSAPALVAAVAPCAAHRGGRLVVACGLALLIGAAAWREWSALRSLAANPITDEARDEPLAEVVSWLAPGSHVLLVGTQDLRDYPLFLPRERFTCRVTPLPAASTSPADLLMRARSERPTHILIADDRQALLGAAESFAHSDLPAILLEQWRAREVPLQTPGMRLFALPTAVFRADRLTWPAENPLVVIADELRDQVGIHAFRGPGGANVEVPNDAEGGFVWIGTGEAAGLRLTLRSAGERRIVLEVHASAGPSRGDRRRTLNFRLADQRETAVFEAGGRVSAEFSLRYGINEIDVWCDDLRDVSALQSGDPRDLIVGIHDIWIGPAKAR
jgi:hypothetical protein